ncbi:MAG: alpha-N-arabinofuranosidase [Lentimicrobiaceae bacterium]|nr:alpha-N-arabinofuranosidase [Lentimicrobiaceae bacterium]
MTKRFVIRLTGLVLFVFTLYQQSGGQNKLTLHPELARDTIQKEIYGHFAEHLGRCIYGGIYVGEDSPIENIRGFRADVIRALREMKIPVLRWPGGCFADTYHWKDGIGPIADRPTIVNVHWGGVTEDNSFGTHEFLDFCELIGAEPYVNINVGSGSVREASEWVEYITSGNDSPMTRLRRQNGRENPWKVKYFGIGNETWGCGGNMSPEYYTDLYRQFASYCFGADYLIASGANAGDYRWTEVMMDRMKGYQWMMQGLSLHYYTVPGESWEHKGSATQFDEKAWHTTMKKALRMERLITRHSEIMDRYDPDKNVGLILDEWGNWHDVEPGTNPGFLYQQNTIRDALTAAINLNIFNDHCDRVKMANIAQMVNVLQSVILTRDDQLVLTPTYYVFKMYTVHQGALMIPADIESEDYILDGDTIPSLHASASRKDGVVSITLCNLNPQKSISVEIECPELDFIAADGSVIQGKAMNDYHDFGQPGTVNIQPFALPEPRRSPYVIELPARSVVRVGLTVGGWQ